MYVHRITYETKRLHNLTLSQRLAATRDLGTEISSAVTGGTAGNRTYSHTSQTFW